MMEGYARKQFAISNIKEDWLICPKCGNDEVYYENPRTGNGLYNCDFCGLSGHERKFNYHFKIRKCILRRCVKNERSIRVDHRH